MLWGLGDSHRPSIATAQLIENIVIQQMFSLLSQAQEIAELRESASIGVQDILFLLRKDKIKIQRLMNYLGENSIYSLMTWDSGKEFLQGYINVFLTQDFVIKPKG